VTVERGTMNCPRCKEPGYRPPQTPDDPLDRCSKCGWPDSRVPHLRIEHLASRADLVRRQGWASLTDPQLYAITLEWMLAEENDRLARQARRWTIIGIAASMVALIVSAFALALSG
jgi:hypothetical protein